MLYYSEPLGAILWNNNQSEAEGSAPQKPGGGGFGPIIALLIRLFV